MILKNNIKTLNSASSFYKNVIYDFDHIETVVFRQYDTISSYLGVGTSVEVLPPSDWPTDMSI